MHEAPQKAVGTSELAWLAAIGKVASIEWRTLTQHMYPQYEMLILFITL